MEIVHRVTLQQLQEVSWNVLVQRVEHFILSGRSLGSNSIFKPQFIQSGSLKIKANRSTRVKQGTVGLATVIVLVRISGVRIKIPAEICI